jgi:hypothetical protein
VPDQVGAAPSPKGGHRGGRSDEHGLLERRALGCERREDPWDRFSAYGRPVSVQRLGVAFADEVAEKPGPRHFQILADADSSPLGARQRGELEKYVDPAYEPTDQQLVIDAEVDAAMSGDREFNPGLLKARFYVYDHTKRQIICAAHVVVKSSSDLWVRYRVEYDRRNHETKSDDMVASAAEHLRGDLRQQALLAASESLFVAGHLEDAGAADAGPRYAK